MDNLRVLTMTQSGVSLGPYWSSSRSQSFRIIGQSDGSVRLECDNGLTLTMSETAAWGERYNGNAWQSHNLVIHDDGSYTIHAKYHPSVLEMTEAGPSPKPYVAGTLVQRFHLQPVSLGRFVIHKHSLVFDTRPGTNDLHGTLQANVKFAQSQILPVEHYASHPQPYLVAGRKALLLVKPLRHANNLEVRVFDKAGKLLGSRTLSSPYMLPNTAYHSEFAVEDLAFDALAFERESASFSVDTDRQLDDPEALGLQACLAEQERVQVWLVDSAWVRDLFLPRRAKAGCRVRVHSDPKRASTVHYSGRTLTLDHGCACHFVFTNNQWVSEYEWENRLLTYSESTWSVEIPARWIQPGFSLSLSSDGATGTLSNVQVGGPGELLINTIDIGMLAPPRNKYAFATDVTAHREYFQTIPVARMIVSDYQSYYLTEVVLPDGATLRTADPSHGGWHEGTMRHRIGKELISLGINHANYGINSGPGEGEWTPYVAAQLTAHNSCGIYANGYQVHGGSGGLGMVTLDDSLGNEFSHELGHNYGLGHYPNGFHGSVHRNGYKYNSTWGWDMDLNKFIPNFSPLITYDSTCLDGTCEEPFHGRAFGTDPMAGGYPMSHLNRYTLHTPYTAALIQTFLQSKAVFSSDSPTGFRKWNSVTANMEPYSHRVDLRNTVAAPLNDLSEAALSALLDASIIVKVSMGDGYWAPEIHVPRPNTANKQCAITIEHTASYNSQVFINGIEITVSRGSFTTYVSNGELWIEQGLLDASMLRITPGNDDLGESTLARLLAEYTVLNIAMANGNWALDIHVPPAAAVNERRFITLDHAAAYTSYLHINGLKVPITTGTRKYFISDGERWREQGALLDVSVERIPRALGVPVTTLIGYYDPEQALRSYIYPELHGAYGFVYDDDNQTVTDADWQLWVDMEGGRRRYKLANRRLQPGVMNKFHINIEETRGVRKAMIAYRGRIIHERTLAPPVRPLTYTVNGE